MPAADDLKVEFDAGTITGAANLEINVNQTTGTGNSAGMTTGGDIVFGDALGLKTVQEARGPGDKRLYGSATFSLSGLIEDGTTLKIGDQSFTFAVGGASKFKDGANVIDLTDIEADKLGDADSLLKIAQRVTNAFKDNKQFHVTFDKDGAGNFTVTEREGSGLDYLGSAIVGDTSKDGTAGDATWEGMVMIGQGTISNTASGGLRLQIGDTADQFNQMNVIVGDMHVNAMGKGKTTLDGKEIDVTKTVADVDISNQDGAAEAIGIIKNAINYVSGIRGDLGAVQNRLDHTAKNLSVMAENIQDAESTIRDTDVAEEMMAYTKNNILIQSAQAMLAQANAVPQGVLQLLG